MATVSPTPAQRDRAMVHARRIELHKHPAPPAGAEVHSTGMWHEVQKGDSFTAIAREYSQAFHMFISGSAVKRANAAAARGGLQPGELLTVPGLEARTDGMFISSHPNLKISGSQLRHVVARGNTLSGLAAHYNETEGLALTWQDLYAANKDVIGDNPGRIEIGQQLRIPGLSSRGASDSLDSLSDLDQQHVLTRAGRVQHENGSIETIDVIRYKADGSHAQRIGSSANDAMAAARSAVRSGGARGDQMVVAQTKDGAYWTVPLRGRESGNLDHTDRTLSLAYRAQTTEVIGVVARDLRSREIVSRRFDR